MKATLHEYNPKHGQDWRGDFYLELEAETMEEAGMLCRLSLNHLKKGVTIGNTHAKPDGTFELSIGILQVFDRTTYIGRNS